MMGAICGSSNTKFRFTLERPHLDGVDEDYARDLDTNRQ
jgi:hypothetical protein